MVGTLVQAEVFTDDFNTPHDYVVDGVQGTIWDDYIGWAWVRRLTPSTRPSVAPGSCTWRRPTGYWDSPWNPLGPYLFKVVRGDFIATVKVTDYAGTAAAPVFHNDGGLMARAFLADAGRGRGLDLDRLLPDLELRQLPVAGRQQRAKRGVGLQQRQAMESGPVASARAVRQHLSRQDEQGRRNLDRDVVLAEGAE